MLSFISPPSWCYYRQFLHSLLLLSIHHCAVSSSFPLHDCHDMLISAIIIILISPYHYYLFPIYYQHPHFPFIILILISPLIIIILIFINHMAVCFHVIHNIHLNFHILIWSTAFISLSTSVYANFYIIYNVYINFYSIHYIPINFIESFHMFALFVSLID